MTPVEQLVRPPAVAGSFYPGEPAALRAAVKRSFAAAKESGDAALAPKAVVVPHAGYAYSGAVAASAYLRLLAGGDAIRRVVLLGPSHRVSLAGLAVSRADAFATPLGTVPIDADARRVIAEHPAVRLDDTPHAHEHSLEVQLPFLQAVLAGFSLVPIAVGHASAETVAEVLDSLWDGPGTLVVVSTDLSHYHPYAVAQARDRRTADAVVAAQPDDIGDDDACGAYPLRGLLVAVRRHGGSVVELDLRNSGDTAGDRRQVVGYGSFAVA